MVTATNDQEYWDKVREDERLTRRQQLRRKVPIVGVSREYEFGPPCESIHNEISIVVWNARSEEDAIQKIEEFLSHVQRRGFEAFASEDEGGDA